MCPRQERFPRQGGIVVMNSEKALVEDPNFLVDGDGDDRCKGKRGEAPNRGESVQIGRGGV